MNVRCRTKMCAVRASNFIVCFKKKILLLDLSLPCVGYVSYHFGMIRQGRDASVEWNQTEPRRSISYSRASVTDLLIPYGGLTIGYLTLKLYRRYRQKLIATQKICKFDFTTFFRSIPKKSGRRRLKCLKSSGGKPLHQGPGWQSSGTKSITHQWSIIITL